MTQSPHRAESRWTRYISLSACHPEPRGDRQRGSGTGSLTPRSPPVEFGFCSGEHVEIMRKPARRDPFVVRVGNTALAFGVAKRINLGGDFRPGRSCERLRSPALDPSQPPTLSLIGFRTAARRPFFNRLTAAARSRQLPRRHCRAQEGRFAGPVLGEPTPDRPARAYSSNLRASTKRSRGTWCWAGTPRAAPDLLVCVVDAPTCA